MPSGFRFKTERTCKLQLAGFHRSYGTLISFRLKHYTI